MTAAPRGQERAGQQAEARADLEDPATGRRVGLREDRVEHVRIGQEVLRQAVTRSQTGRPQRRPDGLGVDPRWRGPAHPAAARTASGSDGRASRSSPARSPAANRRAPAAPIIAPLSVHSAGRGTISGQAERVGLPGEA